MLDTHIWVWWVNGSDQLTAGHRELIERHESSGLSLSVLSCWEVAKLVEKGRLNLSVPIGDWMCDALHYPGMQILPLSPKIAIESTQLPGDFHRDPADQIIVATSRLLAIPLLTADAKLIEYPHVDTPQQA